MATNACQLRRQCVTKISFDVWRWNGSCGLRQMRVMCSLEGAHSCQNEWFRPVLDAHRLQLGAALPVMTSSRSIHLME